MHALQTKFEELTLAHLHIAHPTPHMCFFVGTDVGLNLCKREKGSFLGLLKVDDNRQSVAVREPFYRSFLSTVEMSQEEGGQHDLYAWCSI